MIFAKRNMCASQAPKAGGSRGRARLRRTPHLTRRRPPVAPSREPMAWVHGELYGSQGWRFPTVGPPKIDQLLTRCTYLGERTRKLGRMAADPTRPPVQPSGYRTRQPRALGGGPRRKVRLWNSTPMMSGARGGTPGRGVVAAAAATAAVWSKSSGDKPAVPE